MKMNRFFFLLIISGISSPLFSNTLYFPHAAFGGGWTTTVVIMNTGTTDVSSRLNFYDQGGVNRVAYSADISVPAGGSTRYSLPDTGPATVVWGEFAAGPGTVQGVATFEFRGRNGALVTTAGVLGLQAADAFLLPVDVTPSASTGVAIANVKDGNSVNVGLRLLAEDGLQVAAAQEARLNPLASRAQIATFVTELFPQLAGTTFKGTLIVEAATGAAADSLAATALTAKEGLVSALPVVPAPFPVQQSDLIKVMAGQVGVSFFNERAGVSITIENISSELIYLAALDLSSGRPSGLLSDDRGTDWIPDEWSGLRRLPNPYAYSPGRQADFTAIAPSERITVVATFSRSGGGSTTGTTFSFAFEGTYYTSTGLRSASIGLTGIRAQ